MNANDLAEEVKTGDPSVDGEHAVQLQLLMAIEKALAASDRDTALQLISRLDALTEAHFASEQILMRYHSYPGYWHHEEEHGLLMSDLQRLQERVTAGESDLAGEAAAVRRWLLGHMRSADQMFALFLRESPGDPQ